MSAPQTKVSVFLRDKPLHTQTLPPGTYLIGHGADAKIRFAAEGVAERHARLILRDAEWEIEDLGAGGGTFVDDEEIKGATILQPDQRIRIGEAHLVLDFVADSITDSGEVKVRRTSNAEMHHGRNYVISRTVARGGMGVIKSAHEATLQREVAMKLMLDDSKPAAHDRFCQEAQVTAQLEHPNIVPVHELGINPDGKPFYTMKLVRGISLKRVLELLGSEDADTIRQWPLSTLLTVFQKVCDALAFAHSKGVIHRDLKPANIMLGEYGEALVMDWGLAKLLSREEHRTSKLKPPPLADADTQHPSEAEATTIGPTLSGTVMGTPQYMPPEQANGEVEMMDERTDIYALGAILYYILTLRPPFHGRSSAEIVQNVRAGRIIPFAEACAKKRLPHWPGGRLPESLAAVALKAMSFERADRYPTVKVLQVEIRAYQNGFATSAENAGAWKILGLFLRRHRTLSFAAGLILLSGRRLFGLSLRSAQPGGARIPAGQTRRECGKQAARCRRKAALPFRHAASRATTGRWTPGDRAAAFAASSGRTEWTQFAGLGVVLPGGADEPGPLARECPSRRRAHAFRECRWSAHRHRRHGWRDRPVAESRARAAVAGAGASGRCAHGLLERGREVSRLRRRGWLRAHLEYRRAQKRGRVARRRGHARAQRRLAAGRRRSRDARHWQPGQGDTPLASTDRGRCRPPRDPGDHPARGGFPPLVGRWHTARRRRARLG
ncbi:MAG: protein kinase [Chthoniobacter sp.]